MILKRKNSSSTVGFSSTPAFPVLRRGLRKISTRIAIYYLVLERFAEFTHLSGHHRFSRTALQVILISIGTRILQSKSTYPSSRLVSGNALLQRDRIINCSSQAFTNSSSSFQYLEHVQKPLRLGVDTFTTSLKRLSS